MHAFAELWQPAVGRDEVGREAARVRRGEAEAREAVDLVDAVEELHERRPAPRRRIIAPAVARDNLPEEGDLPHAPFRQRPALGDDVLHRPGALVAARLGHDAEGAIHIAALLDGDKGGDRPLLRPMVADRVLRAGLLGNVDDGGANRSARLAGGAEVVEITGHPVKLLGSDDEVDVGQLVEQRRAARIRNKKTSNPSWICRLNLQNTFS